MGQEKYGQWTFLDVDTLDMAMEEIADLMNYARYTYIKVWLLQRFIAKKAAEHPQADSQGFIPLKEM